MTELQPNDLQTVDGVGPALARGLTERFGTWEALAEAPDESLGSMRGMRKDAVHGVRALAKGRILASNIEDFEGTASAAVAPIAEPVDERAESDSWVLKEIPIDSKTVKRTYVKATPCVCPDCGWDAVDRFELTPYNTLPLSEQAKMREALAEHRRLLHSQRRILTGAEFAESRKGRKHGVVSA